MAPQLFLSNMVDTSLSVVRIWIMAARPKTLWAAVSPVLIGLVMAYGDGFVHWPSALACFMGAILIQIGTNFANDYFDFKKGADTEKRVGPKRVMQAGLVSAKAMVIAMWLVFTLAALCAVVLVVRGGWPMLVIGIASIASGLWYTAGRYSLAYLGLGDLFVFIFFGPVAVAGSYYVQSLEVHLAVVVAGLAPGFMSMGILAVNNLRDRVQDALVHKKTLAVRFGERFAIIEYFCVMLLAFCIPVVVYAITEDHKSIILASATVFVSIPSLIQTAAKPHGAELNCVLARTGQILLLYSIIFSFGWLGYPWR